VEVSIPTNVTEFPAAVEEPLPVLFDPVVAPVEAVVTPDEPLVVVLVPVVVPVEAVVELEVPLVVAPSVPVVVPVEAVVELEVPLVVALLVPVVVPVEAVVAPDEPLVVVVSVPVVVPVEAVVEPEAPLVVVPLVPVVPESGTDCEVLAGSKKRPLASAFEPGALLMTLILTWPRTVQIRYPPAWNEERVSVSRTFPLVASVSLMVSALPPP